MVAPVAGDRPNPAAFGSGAAAPVPPSSHGRLTPPRRSASPASTTAAAGLYFDGNKRALQRHRGPAQTHATHSPPPRPRGLHGLPPRPGRRIAAFHPPLCHGIGPKVIPPFSLFEFLLSPRNLLLLCLLAV